MILSRHVNCILGCMLCSSQEQMTRFRQVLVSRSWHREYREVLKSYTGNSLLKLEEIDFGATGRLEGRGREAAIRQDLSAVVVQWPNFLDVIEVAPELAGWTYGVGALLVVAVTEGVSLGLLRPPAEADIVALEGQSFPLEPSYGGPFVGVSATHKRF